MSILKYFSGALAAAAAVAILAVPEAHAQKLLRDKSHSWRGALETPLSASMVDLDPSVCSYWVDGEEKGFSDPQKFVRQVLVFRNSGTSGAYAAQFGVSPNAGRRHARIGFKEDVPVEGIFASGSGSRPSILRADAAYPGDIADDSQWIPGERSRPDGSLTDGANSSFSFWTFPKGSTTRAIRFTADIPSTTAVDAKGMRQGTVGGTFVFSNRWDNLAQSAIAVTSSNTRKSKAVNDGKTNIWSDWGSESNGVPISAANPQEVMLAWTEPVPVRAIGLNYPRFLAGEILRCTAPASVHPRDADPGDWEVVKEFDGLRSQFPLAFTTVWIDLGETFETRGVKLRITEPIVTAFPDRIKAAGQQIQATEHPHVAKTSNGGTVAHLDEIFAVGEAEAVRGAEARIAEAEAIAASDDSGIEVVFDMPFDGFATLVVEDSTGRRVRNLVSAKPFPKGRNTVRWDASDDLGRDVDAAEHGLYSIPYRPVAPGEYTVRGLAREAIVPRYEFTVYNAGDPPWCTPDHKGGWLANHSAPQAACFLPADGEGRKEPLMLLGANITEGPDGLISVDMDGRKQGGKRWIGGTWTAAAFLARDAGEDAIARHQYYVGSMVDGKDGAPGELRITAIKNDGQEEKIAVLPIRKRKGMGRLQAANGIAARDGVIAASLTASNAIAVVEVPREKAGAAAKQPTRTVPFASPRGLAFAPDGALYAVGSNGVSRVDLATGTATEIVKDRLEDPRGIAVAPDGTIFVSDHGSSHQVKSFAPDGRLLRAYGRPGAPAPGLYDELHMNAPSGIAIDGDGRLWVAECDLLPKRVSVWDIGSGALIRAFYGPPKYGAGGAFDSGDLSRFYYEDGKGLMEFFVDWDAGTNMLRRVLFRPDAGRKALEAAGFPATSITPPQYAIYTPATEPHAGDETIPGDDGVARRRLLSNSYNSSPTQGAPLSLLMAVRGDGLVPVALAGNFDPKYAPGVTNAEFEAVWKALEETLPPARNKGSKKRPQAFFAWSDRDDDGLFETDEIIVLPGQPGGVVFQDDSSITLSILKREEGATTNNPAITLRPAAFTPNGTPLYDLDHVETTLTGATFSPSTGGNQMIVDSEGNALTTSGVRPLPTYSIAGGRDGKATWSYPNMWPGLHAGHRSPTPPREKGRVTAPTRVCGGFLAPRSGEAGPVCAINGNHGDIYLFTSDGLFVDAVFEDARVGRRWGMSEAVRGMDLTGVTPYDEHFWPTFSKTPDGALCIVCNKDASCVVRLDGIESARRIAPFAVEVTAPDLARIAEARDRREAARRAREGSGRLVCAISSEAPVVDGSIAEWDDTSFVTIESRGQAAYFNANSKPYDIRGALRATPTHLYAAWKTQGVRNLANNGGERTDLLFKTGGGVDLMLATARENDPAKPRQRVAAGDVRILAAMVGGKPRVVMYRPVDKGAPEELHARFASPVSTIDFDRVEDITDRVEFAGGKECDYELAIPLGLLGLELEPGMALRGDIGVLRGAGNTTIARLYWCNKATAIVSDVPSEAALQPANWGVIEVK